MSFQKYLDKAKVKAEVLAKKHNIPLPPNLLGSQSQFPGSQNQHPSQAPPLSNNNYGPPIPANKPALQQVQPYWRPAFNPSVPVSNDFKHQTGAGGWGNNELQNYVADPANSFYTGDGKLIVRAIARGGQYTSARLTSLLPISRQRGSLIAVATPPCAPGVWPALWMLPYEPFTWPNEAEIDILETWNGDNISHTCLHWGHFNGEDANKHRVLETSIQDMQHKAIRYELAWWQDENVGRNQGGGKLVWYIDGRAVMKATIPEGARIMKDWQIIINVAMGGNVTQGKTPADGNYDMVIHELHMSDEPTAGWGQFEADFNHAPEGHI